MQFIFHCIYGLQQIWNQQMTGFSVDFFTISSAVGIFLSFLYCYFKRENNFDFEKFILLSALIIYICFMFQLTIYRREWGSEHRVRTDIDLGSFKGDFIAAYQVGYCALNMLFFVPFAMLLTKIRCLHNNSEKKLKTVIMVTLCSFSLSVFIEITQLITGTGIFETTDIFINTVGGIEGTLITVILDKCIAKIPGRYISNE